MENKQISKHTKNREQGGWGRHYINMYSVDVWCEDKQEMSDDMDVLYIYIYICCMDGELYVCVCLFCESVCVCVCHVLYVGSVCVYVHVGAR